MQVKNDLLGLFNVRKVLLIASQYDSFMLEEDGSLNDFVGNIYSKKDLGYIPRSSRVSNEQEAMEALKTKNYDLVIYCIRNFKNPPSTFIKNLNNDYSEIPLVFLLYNQIQFSIEEIQEKWEPDIDIFLWKGDNKIIASIIQYIEDKVNIAPDSLILPVPVILFVEDNIKYYSSYLNILYETLWDETMKLCDSEKSFSKKSFIQKTKAKVVLAKTYESALSLFSKFQNQIIGVISDIEFPMNGVLSKDSGIILIDKIRHITPHLPIVTQTCEVIGPNFPKKNVFCIRKASKHVLNEIKTAMFSQFGFGDLVFRDNNGNIQTRITNIKALKEVLESLNEDSLKEKVYNKSLERWFLVHSEFELAEITNAFYKETLPVSISEKKTILIQNIENLLKIKNRGSIVPYSRKFPLEEWTIGKIGSGSIGGKARGLSFFNKLLIKDYPFDSFPDVHLFIPPSILIGTDVFDSFIKINNLSHMCSTDLPDERIAQLFIQGSIPPTIIGDLRNIILQTSKPIAVRSSSLLEDALYHPFAGIYATKMLPNNEPSRDLRFTQLCNAIKFVYASTFFNQARKYMESTNHIIEEEKMGIIIQNVVGSQKNDLFYPEGSGVIRSFNYYPFGHAKQEDGIVQLAMGLGKSIVDGETTLRFSPSYPSVLPQLSNTESALKKTQKKFWAINMKPYIKSLYVNEDEFMINLPINKGLIGDSFNFIASTYSFENDRLLEGIFRKGPKIITFASLLNKQRSSFTESIKSLLSICENSMASPVEIECALTISPATNKLNFGFLQVRPMMKFSSKINISLDKINKDLLFCYTDNALGNGTTKDLNTIVIVKPKSFDLSKTRDIVTEINDINQQMISENKKYILVGPGRWGSSDPWLGIPVQWNNICNTKAFIEYDLPSLHIDPSQGSHFFQNITSLQIAYLTISKNRTNQFIDWEWLFKFSPVIENKFTQVFHFDNPWKIQADGKNGIGVIYKPTL